MTDLEKAAVDKYRKTVIKEIMDFYEYNYPTASGDFDEFYNVVLNILKNIEQ